MNITVAKFFEKSEYAEAFMKGQLYMNTAKYFAELEGDVSGRADHEESTVAQFQPDRIELLINGHQIDSRDMAQPLRISRPGLLECNIFCMYEVGTDLEVCTRDELREALTVSEDTLKMGSYVVMATNARAFLDRVESAASSLGDVFMKGGRVRYYDPSTHHGFLPEDDWMFVKSDRFEHQREYRIVLDTKGRNNGGAFILNIGELADICVLMSAEEFAEQLQMIEIRPK